MQRSSPNNGRSNKWRSTFARLTAPGLLVIVACAQFYLARTAGLVPWKGGGFGMFSTVDTLEERVIRYEALDAQTGTPTDVLIRYEDRTLQAAHQRTEAQLRLLNHPGRFENAARHLLEQPLVSGTERTALLFQQYRMLIPPDSIRLPTNRDYLMPLEPGDNQTKPLRNGTAARVSLWRRTFSSQQAEAGWEMVGTPTVAGSWPEIAR